MRDRTDPLYPEVNELWKKSQKFSSMVSEKFGKKYNSKKPGGMLELIDTAIETYEWAKKTTVLETLK